jgi:hypothetical protein
MCEKYKKKLENFENKLYIVQHLCLTLNYPRFKIIKTCLLKVRILANEFK